MTTFRTVLVLSLAALIGAAPIPAAVTSSEQASSTPTLSDYDVRRAVETVPRASLRGEGYQGMVAALNAQLEREEAVLGRPFTAPCASFTTGDLIELHVMISVLDARLECAVPPVNGSRLASRPATHWRHV